MAAVIGRQFVEHSDKKMQMEIDIYLPVFTILQFLFFMGLLKVGKNLKLFVSLTLKPVTNVVVYKVKDNYVKAYFWRAKARIKRF